MTEKTFAEGLNTKIVKTQYGEIIKVGVKVEDFKNFLDTYDKNGWVNLNLMTSKDGDKKYFELDTWIPDGSKKSDTAQKNEFGDDDLNINDIPF